MKTTGILGITFADARMLTSAILCKKSMKENGVNFASDYGPDSFTDEFVDNNIDVLNREFGAGLYLWKPWIINDRIQSLKDGDILIYSDAGVEFINNVNHIIDRMDQDIWLFGNMFEHADWCKRECWDMMNMDEVYSTTTKQVQASVIFIRVSPFSRKFIKEWLFWCQMPGCIETECDPDIQHPQFKEHRHDQAILTNLAIKYNIKLHYWPASYNNGAFEYSTDGYDRSVDNYPILFNHHRKRNNEW